MKNRNNKFKQSKLYIFLLVLSFLSTVSSTYAQLPPEFDEFINDNDPNVPISGLVVLGLAVGGVLGLKKLLKKK